jgi:hypothetical protein
LPAWAQAAAALVIFGAGLSVGAVRNTNTTSQPTPAAPTVAATVPVNTQTASVTADDLARLEKQLRSELAQVRSSNPATPVAVRGSDDALLQQVKGLIEESEANQRRDFTLRMVELAGNVENQRRVDLASVRQQIGLQQGAIGTELRQQREVLGRLVSERTR